MSTRNSEKKESICGFFGEDHRRIDAIFDQLEFRSAEDDLPVLEEFSRLLNRHIGWEEEILFPELAEQSPEMDSGPIAVMLEEHLLIRGHLERALRALRAGDLKEARQRCFTLKEVLIPHNVKEENILYPACDAMVDMDRVFDALQ